jgi:ubiquinone/menaquinone biosynthesis C-methylase UbiE
MNTNARDFDTIAREVFAPIYPVIARQILEHTGISEGRCLDVGCGTGYLGLAVAEQSDLELTFYDQSEYMLAITRENIAARGMEERSCILQGDVARIPMQDNSANLAVSRGSLFFWTRPDLAFAEVHRILTPGGKAVLGGGFGSAALKEQVSRQMEAREGQPGQWRAKVGNNLSEQTVRKYEKALREAMIPDYEINLNDEAGLWITISK